MPASFDLESQYPGNQQSGHQRPCRLRNPRGITAVLYVHDAVASRARIAGAVPASAVAVPRAGIAIAVPTVAIAGARAGRGGLGYSL